ncbi:MAG: transcription-repair coupling factor [Deltaproteobacteria bacterium]|nr:transcription-repair coupling factor [Candidatus Anaeroferrophillacea bacterium]
MNPANTSSPTASSAMSLFSRQLEVIAPRIAAGHPVTVAGLVGAAVPLFLARLGDTCRRPLLVVAHDTRTAERLRSETHTGAGLLGIAAGDFFSFPPVQRLPYQQVLPLPRVEQARIAVLAGIRAAARPTVFTSITAAIDRMADPAAFFTRFLTLEWGTEIDRERLLERLVARGYQRVPSVDEPGDFSVRGSIVDIFSPLQEHPCRLDFFGREIESIRPFDPQTQKSLGTEIERLTIAPAREILLPRNRTAVRERLKQAYVELNDAHTDMAAWYERLEHGDATFPGSDALLPAIDPEWHSLRDYLHADTVPVFVGPELLAEKIESLGEMLDHGYTTARDLHRFAWPPGAYLADTATFRSWWPGAAMNIIDRPEMNDPPPPERPSGNAAVPAAKTAAAAVVVIPACTNRDLRDLLVRTAARHEEAVFAPVAETIKGWLRGGFRVLLACRGPAGRDRLGALLGEYEVPATLAPPAIGELPAPGRVHLAVAPLAAGTRITGERFVLLTDTDLFGEKRAAAPPRRGSAQPFFDDLAALKEHDFVTHRLHGIGIYRGLETLAVEGITSDFLVLEYHGGDLVYVPVDHFNLIHPYHGVGDAPPTPHRLGSGTWERETAKARQAIDDLLIELIDLYARRQTEHGHAFPPPDAGFAEFETDFPYEETPDQQQAIGEVIADMTADRPMDRLICGDVGYGKTEVAIRAVFLAVTGGRQAAVLVPTTVLAQQHYETFRERFHSQAINVEVLSRFRPVKEQREILDRLATGGIDIIIGTHRLLQRDVRFQHLGLLVLDEEHKFGVKDKERIKELRREVDVLAMSATPIPRTLHMSLAGIRTMSVINTAPRDRQAIRTYVTGYSDEVVRDAVRKETGRGGQVFFVHNEVRTIDTMARRLENLLPGIRIRVAHGQMRAAGLEAAMLAFARREFDLLLCTTIIESGLDIPSANTMIINNAHRFGLAQLYQLRGRVGRSQRKAYAYLLVPAIDRLPTDARRRLTALAEASDLGAGFRIAMQDLEIRGAGNLLGRRQSGHIAAIGYELYQELLAEAAATRRLGTIPEKHREPEIRWPVTACLPPTYIADVPVRIQLYKRLAATADEAGLDELHDELHDRFGPPPAAVETLWQQKRVKLLLAAYGVTHLDVGPRRLLLTFSPERPPATEKVMHLLRVEPDTYRLTPDQALAVQTGTNVAEVYPRLEKLLQSIF